MFSVDGITWSVPCSIQRMSEITPSEISGLMLDGSYFNDVLGTYMSYTVSLAVPLNMKDAYNRIYEVLTNPADGHQFVLPYNSSIIEITARVQSVSDIYVRLTGGAAYWKGIQFTCISNCPTKTMSLGDVIARGMTPLPDIASVTIGDAYQFTADGWIKLLDADNTSY